MNRKTLMALAIPVYFELISSVISGIVNTFWISSYSKYAVGAVAAATFLENMMIGIIYIVSLGVTVLVSNRIGQERYDDVKRYVTAGWVLNFILILGIAIPGFIFRSEIASILVSSNSSSIVSLIESYLSVMFPGLAILYSQSVTDGIFKGNKDTHTPMKVAILTNIINLVLDPILIFGLFGLPRLGVFGTALATLISRSIAFVWALNKLRTSSLIKRLRDIKVKIGLVGSSVELVKIGVPLGSDFLVRMMGGVLLIRIISNFGEAEVSAYGICTKVLLFCTMGFYGIRQAGSILAARRTGEGFPEDCRVIGKNSYTSGIGIALVAGVILLTFGESIISFFTKERAIIDATVLLLKYFSVYIVPLSFVVTLSGTIIGLGKGEFILAVTVIGVVLQNLGAVVLSTRLGSANGVWISLILACSLQAVVTAAIFYKIIIPGIHLTVRADFHEAQG